MVAEQEPLGCVSVRIRSFVNAAFEGYGHFTNRRPWASILLALAFVAACVPGLAILGFETSTTVYYVEGSYSWRALERKDALWPNEPRLISNNVYFFGKGGQNLFEPATLLQIGRAVDTLSALETSAGEVYEEICERAPGGECAVDNIFVYFRTVMDASLNLTNPEGMGESEGLAYHLGNYCTTNLTKCAELLEPIRGLMFVGTVHNMPSLLFAWHLDPNRDGPDGVKSYESHQYAYLEYNHAPSYSKGEDKLQTEQYQTYVVNAASRSEESIRPTAAEAPLFGIAVLLTLLFVSASIYAPTRPHCRTSLGISCMLIVLLSLACGTGLTAYSQTPATTMSLLVTFTLLGVSVDDIIVIVHAYDRLPGEPSLEACDERIVESLRASGVAVTITSLTSFVAFAVAATNPIPALSSFCVTAAFSILCIYVLQFLLFLPLFVLHERRRLRGRADCGCTPCCGRSASAGSADKLPLLVRLLAPSSVGGGCGLLDRYAKFISRSWLAKVVVLLLSIVAVGIGGWGVTQASSEVDLTDYLIDDSFLKDWFDTQELYWGSRNGYSLVVDHQDGEGLFSATRTEEILGLYNDVSALDHITPPHQNWLEDFLAYLAFTEPNASALAAEEERLRGDPAAFGSSVEAFLVHGTFESPYDGHTVVPSSHKHALALQGGIVKASRFWTYFEAPLSDPPRLWDNQAKTHAVVFPGGAPEEGFGGARVDHMWDFTFAYMEADRDQNILDILYTNLLLACAAVGAVVVLMLNPVVGLFVTFLVVALDIFILALLTLYGQKLDFVAFLCLSMTIGLVVDYSTHTAYAYLCHRGSPEEKLYHSISKMGVSVCSGGGSTVLGMAVLAFAQSQFYRTFFKVLGTAVFIGTGVGVTVGPVLLHLGHRAGLGLAAALGRGPANAAEAKAGAAAEAEAAAQAKAASGD